MSKRTFKKAISLSLATLACAASVATFTGCESARPEVKMELSFNGNTYEVNYVLYRKIAPSTVAHFMALVEKQYYDGLCIHDYDTTNKRMYTGAYKYDTAATDNVKGLVYQKYYDIVKEYKDFPTTVWTGKQGTEGSKALYTLYGEFASNEFGLENGSLLSQTFGSLTMYYTDKGDVAEEPIYVNPINTNVWERYYAYERNSATSQFFISLNATSKTDSAYCTFATPTEDGKDELEDLMDDIQEYIEQHHSDDEDEFVNDVTVDINRDDAFAANEEQTATYAVPKTPIVINSIKVTKY